MTVIQVLHAIELRGPAGVRRRVIADRTVRTLESVERTSQSASFNRWLAEIALLRWVQTILSGVWPYLADLRVGRWDAAFLSSRNSCTSNDVDASAFLHDIATAV